MDHLPSTYKLQLFGILAHQVVMLTVKSLVICNVLKNLKTVYYKKKTKMRKYLLYERPKKFCSPELKQGNTTCNVTFTVMAV